MQHGLKRPRGKRFLVTLLLICCGHFLYSSLLHAAFIPPSIRSFLLHKGRIDLIERYEKIPVYFPQDFIRQFSRDLTLRPVGAGFNGVTFVDEQERLTKLTFSILAGLDLVTLEPRVRRVSDDDLRVIRQRWQSLVDVSVVRTLDVPQLRGVATSEPLGSQPVSEDLLGTLMWAAYNPEHTELPDMVSQDGLAYRTKFIEGVTVGQILKSQREGTELHRRYNLRILWQHIVYWQKVVELMLQDSGVVVDFFSPGNLLVSGEGENLHVTLLDHALARPTEQAMEHYRHLGWRIPDPTFTQAIQLIVWPTHSQGIITNKLWGLSYEQAVEFLTVYHGLNVRHDVVRALASLPRWKIIEAPFLEDFQNIERAQQELAKERGVRGLLRRGYLALRNFFVKTHCSQALKS